MSIRDGKIANARLLREATKSGHFRVSGKNLEANRRHVSRGNYVDCEWYVCGHVTIYGYRRFKFKNKSLQAHRMAYLLHHGEISLNHEVNHINGDKTDNSYDNLELVTPKKNIAHAHATGLRGAL